jgi:prolipoprotein diacylglyceryltransferase
MIAPLFVRSKILVAAAPAMGLSVALARAGCFMGGCDLGAASSLPLAISFPAGSWAFRSQLTSGLLPATAAAALPVHPLQLYFRFRITEVRSA